MMMVCPICGKRFFCQPEFWPYWRGDYYLCSENCMIVFDTREIREKSGWIDDYFRKKEEKKMRKITLDQKKKAVEIAIGGGDPQKFLEECGSANPSAHWYYIKKTLKEKAPEKYAQIPGAADKKYEPKGDLKNEAPDDALDGFEPFEMKDGRKRPVTTCCAPSTREGVEVPDELPEDVINAINEPWRTMRSDEPDRPHKVDLDDDFEIYGLKTKAGDFQTAAGNLCWTFDGFQMNLPVDRWRKLIETVPKVLKVMKL